MSRFARIYSFFRDIAATVITFEIVVKYFRFSWREFLSILIVHFYTFTILNGIFIIFKQQCLKFILSNESILTY